MRRRSPTSLRRLLGAGRRAIAMPRLPAAPTNNTPDLNTQPTSPARPWAFSASRQPLLPPHLLDRPALEVASRQASRAVYLGDGAVLCRVLDKYLIYADSQETGITPHLCLDGYWESWITVVLARTLRRGWHCLDVGANHGYYTLIMADAVGQEGRVAPV